MTPAERLRAAADTIERTAAKATVGAWQVGRGYGEVVSPDAPCEDRERELYGAAVVGETLRGGNAAHVALWDPPTALLLAAQLRESADRADVHPGWELSAASEVFLNAILTGGAS